MKIFVQTIVFAVFFGHPAWLFAADQKPAKASPVPPPIVERGPAAYEPQLLKMAELMGSLAFLADICPATEATRDGLATRDGKDWRDKVAMLIEAEASSPRLKGLIAGAYNRGYSDLEVNYKTCSEPALALFEHQIYAVHNLSQDLARRYSGN